MSTTINDNIKTQQEPETQNNTSTFINQTEYSKLQQQLPKDIKYKYNLKQINSYLDSLPVKSIQDFTVWLGQSSEVLKSNKNVIKYDLTTMTNSSAKAIGNVESLNTTTTTKDYVVGRSNNMSTITFSNDNITTINPDIGFEITKKEIDDLLQKRLTDSLGKQSVSNGKILDLRSWINTNILPVIKNGGISHTHRILETALEMAYLGNFGRTVPGSSSTHTNARAFMYVNLDPNSLNFESVRKLISTQYSLNGIPVNFNVVSKALATQDATRDMLAMLLGAHTMVTCNVDYANQSGTYINSAPHFYYLVGFSWPGTNINVPSTYYDASLLNMQLTNCNGHTFIPAAYINNTGPTNTLEVYRNNYDGISGSRIDSNGRVLRYLFANQADRDIAVSVIEKHRQQGDIYTFLNSLPTSGSYTFVLDEDTSATATTIYDTENANARGGLLYQLCLVGDIVNSLTDYYVMENHSDIVNAIDLLAKLKSLWKVKDSSSSTLGSYTLTRSIPALNQWRLDLSSMWSRIALLVGQATYTYDDEYTLGDESLINNKIFNYSYYRAGIYSSAIVKTYGSYRNRNLIATPRLKEEEQFGFNLLKRKHDDIDEVIPLFVYDLSSPTTKNEGYYTGMTTNDLLVADYFTSARWWRYDYFGGLEQEAPNQRLTMNATDQDYTEADNEIFINTTTPGAAATVGSLTYRFTSNGTFNQGLIKSVSFSPNTAIKFKIPNILKKKDRCKAVLLHGLDLITTTAPVWYAPYTYKYDLVDKGNFDQELSDDLFN